MLKSIHFGNTAETIFFSSGFCPEPEIDFAKISVPDVYYEVGTNITYTFDRCYTGGGTSTCQCDRTWSPAECKSE